MKRAPAHESQSLLEQFERTGCSRAFDALVAMHRDEVFAICFRMLRDAHEAEDAAQAVFLTLAMQARGGNSIDCVPAWLRKVARHVSLDLIKARKRRRHHEDAARLRRPGVCEGEDAARAADSGELRDILARHLQELPDSYRTPIVLFYFGGMSLPQISKQLGVKPKALGVRLLRARRILAERLSSNIPWFAVAAAPVLLHEAIRSGALAPRPFPGAGVLGALQVTNASAVRRIGLTTLVIAFLTSSAGSASMLLSPATLRSIRSSVPVLRHWLVPNDAPTMRLDNRVHESSTPPAPYLPTPLPLSHAPTFNLPPIVLSVPTPPPSAFARVVGPPDQPSPAFAPPLLGPAERHTRQTPFPHLSPYVVGSVTSDAELASLAQVEMPPDETYASTTIEGVYTDPPAPFPVDPPTDAGVTTSGGMGGGGIPEPVVLPTVFSFALLLRRRGRSASGSPGL